MGVDRSKNRMCPELVGMNARYRGGSRPKILGALPPSAPFIIESIFSVLRNRKKYELHIGLHLKSIISRVANSVRNGLVSETRRNEARRVKSCGGVLGRGLCQRATPHQLRGLGEHCKLPSVFRGGTPKNLDVGAFWDLVSHVRTVS